MINKTPKGSDFYYNAAENAMELKSNPSPHRPTVRTASSELKVGSPAHRQKYPARYGYNYTSKLEQAVYPKAGTAPSEIGSIKWALEESPETIVKNPYMKKAITDAEIQKRLDKQRGPHMWDLIKTHADQPEDKKQVKEIIRESYKRDPQSITRDEHKYLKSEDRNLDHKFYDLKEPLVKQFRNDDPTTYLTDENQQKGMLLATVKDAQPKPKKINTYPEVRFAAMPVRDSKQEAALEKMRVYAFKPTPNPDESKGIGSFKNTIGRKLRAATSRSDWEKNNRTTYK